MNPFALIRFIVPIVPIVTARLLHSKPSLFPSSLIIKATRLWISVFVQELNLCPFSHSLNNEKLRITISHTKTTSSQSLSETLIKSITEEFLHECSLLQSTTSKVQTSLIIYPKLLNFNTYLNTYDLLNTKLEELNLDEFIQIASFHPKYQFQGESSNVSNWTNRSPFPMIHLLKVNDVMKAIEGYEKATNCSTDVIWKNNIQTMQKLGLEKIKYLNSDIMRKAREEDASFPSSPLGVEDR